MKNNSISPFYTYQRKTQEKETECAISTNFQILFLLKIKEYQDYYKSNCPCSRDKFRSFYAFSWNKNNSFNTIYSKENPKFIETIK